MPSFEKTKLLTDEISILFIGEHATYMQLKQCFQQDGYYTFTLAVPELHASLRQHTPHLVLLDMNINTEDSIAICQQLHQHTTQLPIIIHGYANEVEKIEAIFLAGASEFFPKPLNATIMRRRIKNILQAQHDARELTEKNAYLQNVLSSATDYAMITADTDFNIIYMNPRFEMLFQVKQTHMQQHSLQHFFTNTWHAGDFLQATQKVNQGETHTWVRQYADKHLQLRFSAILDTQGLCMGYALSVLDISQSIQDTKSLVLTRQVFDKAIEGICILNAQWQVIDCNKAFLRMLNTQQDALLLRHVRILHPQTKNKGLYREVVEKVITHGHWKGVLHIGGPTHHTAGYWLSLSALQDTDGNISHYVGLFTDIRQYAASRRLRYQHQKMEAMRTLVGGVAHHFNNMLAGMLGSVFLAKMENEDPQEREKLLESCEEIGFQAGDMIHQLARFSHKDDSLKHALVLQEAINHYFSTHSTTQQQVLSLNMACFPLSIQSDVTQFEQVLSSIMHNAFEAVEKVAEPHIQVDLQRIRPSEQFFQTHTELEETSYALLCISDNGQGIEKKNISHVFDPFFTTKDIGKGCGLSLAIAYNIVEEHGGVIEVQSQNKQTSFKVYLPLL